MPELREDMPVICKAAVPEGSHRVTCRSGGHIITSALGHTSTGGQSTPVFSCQFLERAFSLSPGPRLLFETMLPQFTNVKPSPFTIPPRQANPTRRFWVSSVDWAAAKRGGHAEPLTVFRNVNCALLHCHDSLPPTLILFGGEHASL